MSKIPSDVAFTASVKAVQARKGSRKGYARMEESGGWETQVTEELAEFIGALDMFYLATANAAGQPYVQYRGGATGFLKVIDERTLGFADFGGNRQYISIGNLAENPKAFLFLMDYANSRRVKIWGTAEVIEGDAELIERLRDREYPGIVERAFVFKIQAWDMNCHQHIHKRVPMSKVVPVVEGLQRRVEELEAEVALLRKGTV